MYKLRFTSDETTTSYVNSSQNDQDKSIKLFCGGFFSETEAKQVQVSKCVMELYVDRASTIERKVYSIDKDDKIKYLVDVIKNETSSHNVYIDITDELQDSLKEKSQTVRLLVEGDTTNYYEFDDSLSQIYIEYTLKNDENSESAFLTVDQSKAGTGQIDLATGQLNFNIPDLVVGNSPLPITISHHYNQSIACENKYNCGKGWKLNCQQYLERAPLSLHEDGESSECYVWTDAEGKRISFYKKYYYLTQNNNRVYVAPYQIQMNADGSFSTTPTYGSHDLKVECVSEDGCILEIEPDNKIKYKDLFYTATDEIANHEQRLKSLNDAIDQITSTQDSLLEQKRSSYETIINEIKNVCMNNNLYTVFTEFYEEVGELEKSNELLPILEKILGNNNHRDDITLLLYKIHYYSFVNRDEKGFLNENEDGFVNEKKDDFAKKFNDLKDDLKNLEEYLSPYYRVLLSTPINNKLGATMDEKGEKSLFDKYFNLNTYIRKIYKLVLSTISNIQLTEEQFEDQSNKLSEQLEEYNTQKFQCEEQLKYYRQNQPTAFIKDGDLIYGFAKVPKTNLMRLILVADKFENYISYSHDKENKLVRVDSSNGDSITLNYDKDLLCSIIDTNGKRVGFSYTNNKLTYGNCNYFDYDENGYLTGIINWYDILGVGFKYSGSNIVETYGLQKYNSIKNGKTEGLLESEINQDEKVTLSYLKLKKHHPISIEYYDYKTRFVTDTQTDTVKTYLFSSSGKLEAVYDGKYQSDMPEQNTKSVSYQRNGYRTTFQATKLDWAEELITTEPFADSFLEPSEFSNAYESYDGNAIENKVIEYTLSNESIKKIKQNKTGCLVLSGWAKADSPWIKTFYCNSFEHNQNSYKKDLTSLVLSNNDGRENRKFELRMEITWFNGQQDVKYIYNTSFDWMNNNWQYCALPVRLYDYIKDNLTSIKLIFDYSNNYGKVEFTGMSLKEGAYSITKSDNMGKLSHTENSETEFTKSYEYYEDTDQLDYVEYSALIPNEEDFCTFTESHYYNSNKALSKVIQPDGMVTEYIYDDKGNIVKEMVYHKDEPANKFVTETIINKDGSQTESVDALGNKTISTFNKKGELTEQTDCLGDKVSFGYDDIGNMLNMTATENGETSSNENVYLNGLLVKTKHNGCEYEFDYDGEGRRTAIRINGETYCTVSYDDKDTQLVTYANGEQVQRKTFKDGDSYKIYSAPVGEKITDFIVVEYDKTIVSNEKDKRSYKEQIKDRTTNGEKITYETQYDKKGRVAETQVSGGNYGDKFVINNTYGFENALEQQTVKIGKTTMDTETRSYEYGIKNKLLSIEHENAFTETPTLDKLGRVSRVEKNNVTKQFNYLQKGERATTLVASETFGEQGQKADKLAYTYDKKGNITEIRENGELVSRYEYDSLNRLVREDNRPLNKSIFFTYDSTGNITQRKESAFTLGLSDTVEKTVAGSYVYADNGVMDRLLSYNGEECKYDIDESGNPTNTLGNPTTYRDKQAKWSHVNRLVSLGDVSFKYNYAGTRLFKTVGDKTIKYYCSGSTIMCQDDGTDNLYFYYGTEGITGFKYNEEVYHYKKDMLGNILGIYDANGQLLVKYVYDAWGNHKTFAIINGECIDISDNKEYTINSSLSEKLAILNPFRYRSYYFDIEIGLYYLQTRYYDPETGRFISMDDISYIDPESIHGLNLYAYCDNNPVMRTDSQGTNWWTDFWNSVAGAIAKISIGVVLIGTLAIGSVLTGGLLSVVLAGATIGAIGGAVGGGISGLVSGGGLQGFANGFLAGSITGAISGAVGASPLGLGFQMAINTGLGMVNYAMVQGLNGQKITLGGLVVSGILGCAGGYLGGDGWMKGVKDLLRIDVTKNFLKVALSYAGLNWTLKALANSLLLSGVSGGLYGRITSWLNKEGNFIGW